MTTLDAARILYAGLPACAQVHQVTLRIGSRSRDFTMTTRQVNRWADRLAEAKPARKRGWLVVDGIVAARWGRRPL